MSGAGSAFGSSPTGRGGLGSARTDLAVFRVAVDVALVLPCVTVNVLAPVSSCERCSMARGTC
jgi:hypothetical protein